MDYLNFLRPSTKCDETEPLLVIDSQKKSNPQIFPNELLLKIFENMLIFSKIAVLPLLSKFWHVYTIQKIEKSKPDDEMSMLISYLYKQNARTLFHVGREGTKELFHGIDSAKQYFNRNLISKLKKIECKIAHLSIDEKGFIERHAPKAWYLESVVEFTSPFFVNWNFDKKNFEITKNGSWGDIRALFSKRIKLKNCFFQSSFAKIASVSVGIHSLLQQGRCGGYTIERKGLISWDDAISENPFYNTSEKWRPYMADTELVEKLFDMHLTMFFGRIVEKNIRQLSWIKHIDDIGQELTLGCNENGVITPNPSDSFTFTLKAKRFIVPPVYQNLRSKSEEIQYLYWTTKGFQDGNSYKYSDLLRWLALGFTTNKLARKLIKAANAAAIKTAT